MTGLIQPVVNQYNTTDRVGAGNAGCGLTHPVVGADTAGCIYEHVHVYGYMCMYTGGAIRLCMCIKICIGALICMCRHLALYEHLQQWAGRLYRFANVVLFMYIFSGRPLHRHSPQGTDAPECASCTWADPAVASPDDLHQPSVDGAIGGRSVAVPFTVANAELHHSPKFWIMG